MRNSGTVYLMASQPRGTLYLGVTSDLNKRVWQHRTAALDGFTKRYGVKRLVWFEHHDDIVAAIAREKAMKFWKRVWKDAAIEATNPHWDDLAIGLGFDPLPPGDGRPLEDRRSPGTRRPPDNRRSSR